MRKKGSTIHTLPEEGNHALLREKGASFRAPGTGNLKEGLATKEMASQACPRREGRGGKRADFFSHLGIRGVLRISKNPRNHNKKEGVCHRGYGTSGGVSLLFRKKKGKYNHLGAHVGGGWGFFC